MTTDDERREAAERLRDVARADGGPLGDIGFTEAMHRALGGDDWRDMTERLADLVDPDTTTDTTKSAAVTPKSDGTRERLARALGIDLPALLALADEMDHPIRQAVWNQTTGVRREHIMAEYAHRIREACGEAVG